MITETPRGTYLTTFLEKDLVVLTECNTEDDRGDVFEAVNPLLSFTSLPADVEHAGSRSASVHIAHLTIAYCMLS